MTPTERYRAAKVITLFGAFTNAMLGLVKLLGGYFFHSHALIADGFHSFSDLLTDLMVVFASKYGSLDADATHPYGHQRIETAATLILALFLILAGGGIAWDAISEVIHHSHNKPGFNALIIAILSIIANEILFYYTKHVGHKIQSALVIANAWHHRSDAASSLVVALGLLGTLLGFISLDAVAAIIVGLMIIKMGLDYGWNSVKELVDTAVDEKTFIQIEQLIQGVDGVKKIHQLRSRFMGHNILIDVHILVCPYISVSEGHFIAQHVHQTLLKKLQHVKDVIVHVDPEDDETACPSIHLPNRKSLEDNFFLPWQKKYRNLSSWTIHYLDGQLQIDLIFNADQINWDTLKEDIQKDLKQFQYPIKIVFLTRHEINDEKT